MLPSPSCSPYHPSKLHAQASPPSSHLQIQTQMRHVFAFIFACECGFFSTTGSLALVPSCPSSYVSDCDHLTHPSPCPVVARSCTVPSRTSCCRHTPSPILTLIFEHEQSWLPHSSITLSCATCKRTVPSCRPQLRPRPSSPPSLHTSPSAPLPVPSLAPSPSGSCSHANMNANTLCICVRVCM